MHGGPRLCARCGHVAASHRRPGWLWALLGRFACSHRYAIVTHGTVATVSCACDGWKHA